MLWRIARPDSLCTGTAPESEAGSHGLVWLLRQVQQARTGPPQGEGQPHPHQSPCPPPPSAQSVREMMLEPFALFLDAIFAVFRRVRRNPEAALGLALLLVAAWLWVGRSSARDLAAQRAAQATAWQAKFRSQKMEMEKFVGVVRQARVDAARLDRENADRVQREWAANLGKVKNGYEADLAAARAAVALRLHGGNGAPTIGNSGGGGDAQLSALPVLSTGVVRAGDAAIVDGGDIDASTVNTVRLERLILAWTLAAAIDVNHGPTKGR